METQVTNLETQSRALPGESLPAQSYAYSYHDWNGLPSAVTNSAGLSVGYGYDLMDRPTNIAWRAADGALLRGFEMRYNILGMITNVTQTGASLQPLARAYAYDSLDRLVGRFHSVGMSTPSTPPTFSHRLGSMASSSFVL